MTIYEIKRLTETTAPYFFDTKTLKFFGQTLKSFSVQKCNDGRYFLQAPRKHGGYTTRFFNPQNNRLEAE